MKALLKVLVVLLSLLFVLTACNLVNQVYLVWSIDNLTATPTNAHIEYTVTNSGIYDLTGINLEIGAYVSGTYVTARTSPDFDLSQNQSLSSSIDINTSGYGMATGAAVLGVEMNKP